MERMVHGKERARPLFIALVLAELSLLAGCSASGDSPSPAAPSAGGAGAFSGTGGVPAASGGTVLNTGGLLTSPKFEGFEDAGAGLQARVQIAGNDGVCGACVVLSVQAQGGATPYTYEWSDPAFTGAGPHTVCPGGPVRYSVIVKDSSGIDSREIQRPPQRVELPIALRCTEAPPDAGAAPDDGLNGCLAIPKAAESVNCPALDSTESSVASDRLGFAPTPGSVYQYTYDQLLPIGLGDVSTVDVYLGKTPCDRAQKIFSLTLDNMWTQTYCFRIEDEFAYSTSVVHVNGIPFTFGAIPTVCDSCTKGTPPP